MNLQIKRLEGKKDEVRIVQQILEEAPQYSINVSGEHPDQESGAEVFRAIPPPSLNIKINMFLECTTNRFQSGLLIYSSSMHSIEQGFAQLSLAPNPVNIKPTVKRYIFMFFITSPNFFI
jgi:hypothetical protein